MFDPPVKAMGCDEVSVPVRGTVAKNLFPVEQDVRDAVLGERPDASVVESLYSANHDRDLPLVIATVIIHSPDGRRFGGKLFMESSSTVP